ncbi:MAG: FkbM family methyltransferase [Anaerolineae bacterium]
MPLWMDLARRTPPRLRSAIMRSPLGGLAHRTMDRAVGEGLAVVDLAPPLAGHRMRLDLAYQRGMAYGDYELAVTRTIAEIVQPGWLVADIGAQIGYMTLLMASRVGPAGRVLAFEPMPANFAVLEENVRLNGYKTVQAERLAVADQSGATLLHRLDDRALSATSSIVAEDDGADGIEVATVSMDDYLAAHPGELRFAKIDVEGAEDLVLAGMTQTLARCRPLLLVEVHGAPGPDSPALARLAACGYNLASIDGEGQSDSITLGYRGHVLARPA